MLARLVPEQRRQQPIGIADVRDFLVSAGVEGGRREYQMAR
jgi:hypothetical protein